MYLRRIFIVAGIGFLIISLPIILGMLHACIRPTIYKYGGGIYQIAGMIFVVWGINNRSKYYLEKSLIAQFLDWVVKPKPKNYYLQVQDGHHRHTSDAARLKALPKENLKEIIKWIDKEIDDLHNLIQKTKSDLNDDLKKQFTEVKKDIEELKRKTEDQKKHFAKGQIDFIPGEIIGVIMIITGIFYSMIA
jgi:gas vesicle protein